jgi:polyhydroxybutyrate depolymerase
MEGLPGMSLRAVAAVLAPLVVGSLLTGCSSGADRTAAPTPTTAVPARASAGCTAEVPVGSGEEKVTLTAAGRSGWYFRHVPASYRPARPMPVVVDLHGYSESAEIHLRMSELGAFGDKAGFVTITPQVDDPVPMWNTDLRGADLAWIGALLDEVEGTVCVDRNRVHVAGMSMGAFMTSAVACRYADRVASVAPVAGIRDIDGCRPSRPVPVVAFHGTDDGFVAWEGGYGKQVASLPRPDGSGPIGSGPTATTGPEPPSIQEITAAWAERNGCRATPSAHRVADDVVELRFPCPAHREVELYRIDGGGHAWPGSEFSASVARFVGKTTMSISADEVMWRFFQQHPLRPASSG